MTAVAGTSGPVVPSGRHPRQAGAASRKGRDAERAVRNAYINRELAWLEYSARVLHEAADPRNPLLERVRFLTIFAAMLDEFFQLRVSGLRQHVAAGPQAVSPDRSPACQQPP